MLVYKKGILPDHLILKSSSSSPLNPPLLFPRAPPRPPPLDEKPPRPPPLDENPPRPPPLEENPPRPPPLEENPPRLLPPADFPPVFLLGFGPTLGGFGKNLSNGNNLSGPI